MKLLIRIVASLVLFLVMLIANVALAQNTLVFNADSTMDISIDKVNRHETSKSKAQALTKYEKKSWSTITTYVKYVIQAKQSSSLLFTSTKEESLSIEVTYVGKKYTLRINNEETLITTTVAAIRSAISVELFKLQFGKVPTS